MNDATTEDCKQFLASQADEHGWPTTGAWKRVSKSKSPDGWQRTFAHSSGWEVQILEPFGQGSAGLKIDLGTIKNPASAAQSLEADQFAKASPGLQSAMRWVDAMLVLGKKKPLYAMDPGAHGWSWKDFFIARHDCSGNDKRGMVEDLAQTWVEEGMSDEAGVRLLKSKISWCFSNDADYYESEGFWKPGKGVDVCMWASDAPDEEPGTIAHPAYEMDYENQMEGVWCLGQAGATGKQAMVLAWETLQTDGIKFDMAGQRKFGQDTDFDENYPLHKKVLSIIPELIAAHAAGEAVKAEQKVLSPSKLKPKN